MANTIIPLGGADPFPPEWLRRMYDAGYGWNINFRHALGTVPEGFLSLSENENSWNVYPVMGDLPPDDFEVLLRLSRTNRGEQSYMNTGGGLFFGSDKSIITSEGYALVLGSGTAYRTAAIYERPLQGSQTNIGSESYLLAAHPSGTPLLVRVRRSGDTLRMKAWVASDPEPVEWGISTTSARFQCTHISLLAHGYTLCCIFHEIAIATNGDTATLEAPAIRTMRGAIPQYLRSRYIHMIDRQTHAIIDTVEASGDSGIWEYDVAQDAEVYARVDQTGLPPSFDLLFAKGPGFLAGEYPDGIVTVEGVPAEADLRVLLRSDDMLDGLVVARARSKPDGTYLIPGLNPALEFDLVARKEGRNDVIASRVKPVPVEGLYAASRFQLNQSGEQLVGFAQIWGGTPPYSVDIAGGNPPPGVTFSVSGDTIVVDDSAILGDGDYDWTLRVADDQNEEFYLDCSVSGVVAYPIAEVVGWDSTLRTTNSTSSVSVTIPADTQAGDLLMLSVQRRHPLTAPSGWTVVGDQETDTYEQHTTLLTKVAEPEDAGSSVTVSGSLSGLIAAAVATLRSRYGQLGVIGAESSSGFDPESAGLLLPFASFPPQAGQYYYLGAMSFVYANTSTPYHQVHVQGADQLSDHIPEASNAAIRLAVAGRLVRAGETTEITVSHSSTGNQDYACVAARIGVTG